MDENTIATLSADSQQEKVLARKARKERSLEIRDENIKSAREKIKALEWDIKREESSKVTLVQEIEDIQMDWENLEQAKQELNRPRESWTEMDDETYAFQCYVLRERIELSEKKRKARASIGAIQGGF